MMMAITPSLNASIRPLSIRPPKKGECHLVFLLL
jgi:hypothetical protein